MSYEKRAGDLSTAVTAEMRTATDVRAIAGDADLAHFQITLWNWPLMLIAANMPPALAAGSTMVLKPSEILHDAGVPKGVINLVHGNGPVVGNALTSHPDVDLVSFTGSTAAGGRNSARCCSSRPKADKPT